MEKETKKKQTVKKETKSKGAGSTSKKTKPSSQNEVLDVVYILDKSGSMCDVTEETIKGYNSYIESQKGNNVRLTTVVFDTSYKCLTERQDIKEVKNITKKEYTPGGCTALYDAVGWAIKKLDEEKPKKVLFIINTDGYENASREFNKSEVKKLITSHKKWEFMYLGANIDSYAEASGIGIKASNTSNYKKDEKGTELLYETLGAATQIMCCYKKIDKDWKKDLNDYLNENAEDDED